MHHRAAAISLVGAAALAVALACGSSNDSTAPKPVSKIVNLSASLTPSGEVGATLVGNPAGSGTFTATLDTSTNLFTYNVQFSGLSSTISLGHIHGPFIVGGTSNSAGAILNFDPAASGHAPDAVFTGLKTGTSGSATGSIVLSAATQITTTVNGDSLRKLILAGLTYANIHTTNNPGGEIRGQISVVKSQ